MQVVFLSHRHRYEHYSRLLKKFDFTVVCFHKGNDALEFLRLHNAEVFIACGLFVSDGLTITFLREAIKLYRDRIKTTILMHESTESNYPLDTLKMDGLDIITSANYALQDFSKMISEVSEAIKTTPASCQT